MTYLPNRLILESGHRLVVEHFSRLPGMRLALRPARKRLFAEEPKLSSLQVELNKPAFAALIRDDDPQSKPYLIFETDQVSAGIRDLYRNADLPFVESDMAQGRGMFRFDRPGFSAKLQFDDRGDRQAVESLLCWAETVPDSGKGSLVRNGVESGVARAALNLSKEMGISVHHHVPFGYVAGYRPDLPRSIARHTIEVTVSCSAEVNSEAPVFLPLRIETLPESERDEESITRDEDVAEFVVNVGMPMAAIQPAESGYRLTYSLDGFDEVQLDADDVDGWRDALKSMICHAMDICASAAAKTDTQPV